LFSFWMSRITPFHLVDLSPWPVIGSFSGFSVAVGLLFFLNKKGYFVMFVALVLLLVLCYFWWVDVTRESTYTRFHTICVQKNLLLSMIWFIISEVFFFFRFFWTFGHSSVDPVTDLGIMWPPAGVVVLNPVAVPLLNTLVLLSSGFLVTWAHYSLLLRNFSGSIKGMIGTISLGVFFTVLQVSEYFESGFNITDSVYGSIFFLATRFHGFHVLVRSIFLIVSTLRLLKGHFTISHHVRLECAIWYWHFVDVVWIFLYMCIYLWGSSPLV